MSKPVLVAIAKKFSQDGVILYSTEGKGRKHFLITPDDGLIVAIIARELTHLTKPFVFDVLRMDLEQGEGIPEGFNSDNLTENSYMVFSIQPRRKSPPKDKNAPKRASNGYIMFVKLRRQILTERNPGVPATEITSMLGKDWHAFQAEVEAGTSEEGEYAGLKEQTDQMVTDDKIRAAAEKEAYTKGEFKPKEDTSPKDKKIRKRGYLLFNKEHREEVKANHPDMTPGKVTRELGVMWKKQPEAVRNDYNDKAAQ